MATFYVYFFIFVSESIIYLNRCVSSFTQSITAFFVNAFISTLLSFYSLPSLLPSLLSPLTFSILYFSPPIIFPPLLSFSFPLILPHHIALSYSPLCVVTGQTSGIRAKQHGAQHRHNRETEGDNTAEDITRAGSYTASQHTHTPHTALIILHRIRELNPICHSTNLPSLSHFLFSLSHLLLSLSLSLFSCPFVSLPHFLLSFLCVTFFFPFFISSLHSRRGERTCTPALERWASPILFLCVLQCHRVLLGVLSAYYRSIEHSKSRIWTAIEGVQYCTLLECSCIILSYLILFHLTVL